MRHMLPCLLVTLIAPSAMAQNLSVIQKYLQSETAYTAQPVAPSAAPAQPVYQAPQAAYAPSQPSYSPPTSSPMQQYLQSETGYAPAPQPAPVQQSTTMTTSSASIVGMDF